MEVGHRGHHASGVEPAPHRAPCRRSRGHDLLSGPRPSGPLQEPLLPVRLPGRRRVQPDPLLRRRARGRRLQGDRCTPVREGSASHRRRLRLGRQDVHQRLVERLGQRPHRADLHAVGSVEGGGREHPHRAEPGARGLRQAGGLAPLPGPGAPRRAHPPACAPGAGAPRREGHRAAREDRCRCRAADRAALPRALGAGRAVAPRRGCGQAARQGRRGRCRASVRRGRRDAPPGRAPGGRCADRFRRPGTRLAPHRRRPARARAGGDRPRQDQVPAGHPEHQCDGLGERQPGSLPPPRGRDGPGWHGAAGQGARARRGPVPADAHGGGACHAHDRRPADGAPPARPRHARGHRGGARHQRPADRGSGAGARGAGLEVRAGRAGARGRCREERGQAHVAARDVEGQKGLHRRTAGERPHLVHQGGSLGVQRRMRRLFEGGQRLRAARARHVHGARRGRLRLQRGQRRRQHPHDLAEGRSGRGEAGCQG